MQHLALFSALFFIFALSAVAGCRVSCTSAEIAKSTPRCSITSVISGQTCVITASQSLAQRIQKVILVVDISDIFASFGIENKIGPNKLEIAFERIYPNINSLTLHGDYIYVTAESLANLPNLQNFTFISGKFDRFPAFSTTNRNLRNLILHNFTTANTLEIIGSALVSSLPNLQNIRLCPPSRWSLSDGALSNLPLLKTMILCNLSNIETAFRGGCTSFVKLKEVSIHHSDLVGVLFLQCLPERALLEQINFDFNAISSIKGLNGFTNLQLLGLFQNKIASIHRSLFTGLSGLTFLNLPGNLISEICEDTFRDLPALKSLNLDVNPLTTLSPGVIEYLPKLSHLKLPLMHCDCSLQWLSIVSATHNFHINPQSICGSPDEFVGLNVYDPPIYADCADSNPYTCFSKHRYQCKDNSYCRGTCDGFECVCEGENKVYSRAHGDKCFDIDEVLEMPATCNGVMYLNDANVLTCGYPNKVPLQR